MKVRVDVYKICGKIDDLSLLAERLGDWLKDVDARVNAGINFGKIKGFIKTGDPVIVVTGWKQGSGFTNTMRIVYVSDQVQSICGCLNN